MNDEPKNIEVEIRAYLDDITNFKNHIEKHGAELISSLYVDDIYFCKKKAKTIEDVEMNEVGSYSLRLRKIKHGTAQEVYSVNTKTITNHGDHNAWEEHETEVSNFSETARIFNTMEFKPFFKLEKERFVYKFNNMEICVEDIIDFGGAVEIEIMCSHNNEAIEAKEKIKAFLRKCGIIDANIVPKSITNILMKERAFKQQITI